VGGEWARNSFSSDRQTRGPSSSEWQAPAAPPSGGPCDGGSSERRVGAAPPSSSVHSGRAAAVSVGRQRWRWQCGQAGNGGGSV
jgi:hypothetical protein